MKRYSFTSDDTCHAGCRLARADDGEYVKYYAVRKLIVKLTQGTEWNSVGLSPIEGDGCFIMLLGGEIKPAIMVDGVWTKLAGYPYLFDFKKSDVIKWRYDRVSK